MQDQVSRSIEMGEGIRLIEEWRRRMTKSIGLYGITSQQDLLEEANETVFYLTVVEAKIAFQVEDGVVESLTLFQGGKEMLGKKIE